MSDFDKFIGHHIVTSDLGIGLITHIEKINEDLFFKVSFPSVNTNNFFSVTNNGKYRLISSVDEIKSAIENFKKSHQAEEFESTKDKINFYKKALKSDNIDDLAKNLSILNIEEEIHTSFKTIFEKSLDSFVQEIEFVLKIKNIEAWKLLGLNKNNK